jgi:HD-GYP domain-containing protein (c-di-GMP phosphodiesterase class II)
LALFSDVATHFRRVGNASSRQPAVPPGPTLTDLMLAVSKAMDLLEGKPLRSSMKTAVIAGSVARLLALPDREVASVTYAALLHDIGLASLVASLYPHLPPGASEKSLFQTHAALNARVISMPYERPVSDELFHLFHQHPLAAADFIRQAGLSRDVAELAAAHHELCDGTGYPLGLELEQIPLGGRILAFADVVENVLDSAARDTSGLTSRRHALESFLEIKTPGRFDAGVVEVFKTLMDTHDDFLKRLSSLEVEQMVRQLLPERSLPLDGLALHRAVTAMGGLSDSLMPLYKKDRSRQVADMALCLAESLGIREEQCGELVSAALLMDIGHLATPAHILFKTGPLSSEERSIIQDHPHWTQEILKGVPGFGNVNLWAGEHHERLNGKGYPARLKGVEISIGGRILALADVFDALTSPRPYRTHAHEPMDALPVIGQGRQTLYDNALVTQLRTIVLNSEIPVRY